jgi:hypothetical protein
LLLCWIQCSSITKAEPLRRLPPMNIRTRSTH